MRAKPALQKRSKETRDKIVAALDRLLKDQSFDSISVAELANEAGVSVGAVYRRFENKEALIPVVLDLYREKIGSNFSFEPDTSAGLRATMRDLMRESWRALVEHGHLLRAVHLYSHQHPELIGKEWEPVIESSRAGVATLIDLFPDEVQVEDREAAIEALAYFLSTSLIEGGLYPDVGPPFAKPLQGEGLAEQMADFATGYLTLKRD
ncbi:TetR/AcrR family transcriptional regulator [Sphingomicrobium sediminis]|uniref:TetR/AcrR family transcriptional regulator n=1 Tax=Sphingomicrobium sediminis TaxID=2950949 RepID=A0A9X2EIE3_9SPHN|nr:TetR/AcrR family transcriptional regulator [Sphingomicrobium sediminis]MCM8556264.1 TetR/AcrR family transcriptional regulator [Sphingomicrobium sediminis]